MERSKRGAMLAAALMVVAAVAMLPLGGMAQNTPSKACASKLISCQAYLKSTSPPESCCGPLKEAVAKELPCLCALYDSPEVFKAFNINITDALALPKHCGIPSDLSACKSTAALGPGSPSSVPPATPGSDNKGGASTVSWIGLGGLMSLLLFWLSTVA